MESQSLLSSGKLGAVLVHGGHVPICMEKGQCGCRSWLSSAAVTQQAIDVFACTPTHAGIALQGRTCFSLTVSETAVLLTLCLLPQAGSRQESRRSHVLCRGTLHVQEASLQLVRFQDLLVLCVCLHHALSYMTFDSGP